MRFKQIDLAWFRGAADAIQLKLDGKSAVIYGENGSGKSSFVDAVEFSLNDGKIGHLTHEYSGTNQEHGLLNTHTPNGKVSRFSIRLTDESQLEIEFNKNGAATVKSNPTEAIRSWDYRQVVLRQNEVADFIASTKGKKYSALLPLLGLSELESAAERVRQLSKQVESVSSLKESRGAIQVVLASAKKVLGETLDTTAAIDTLWTKYCSADPRPHGVADQSAKINERIDTQLSALSAQNRTHLALAAVAEVEVVGAVGNVRTAAQALGESSEPLLESRLDVLRATALFAASSAEGTEVTCPACGRAILVHLLKDHVSLEEGRLESTRKLLAEYRSTLGVMADAIITLRTVTGNQYLADWRKEKKTAGLQASFDTLELLDPAEIRTACTGEQLDTIAEAASPLIEDAAALTVSEPREAKEIADDKKRIEAVDGLVQVTEKQLAVEIADRLMKYLADVEELIRAEIRDLSTKAMDAITTDIQRMWSILHPDNEIKSVRLHQPADADKAIDIELVFHGKALSSPRLTLSEGNRNSLGLCIFLAMALQAGDTDCPVILDDVVVSLDRNHRGMIVELLQKEFGNRQVVILTHDRDWYSELRTQLGAAGWEYKVLVPYAEPTDGIRWSAKTSTFGDARAQLAAAPDTAGNTARKLMDVELAGIVDRLRLRLEYRQGIKNDVRMAHEFIERFVADSKKAFEIKDGAEYRKFVEAVSDMELADKLLLTWGNKGSHTFDLAKTEATKLIDTCETAVERLRCATCTKPVYQLADGKGLMQCSCGGLRWRGNKL